MGRNTTQWGYFFPKPLLALRWFFMAWESWRQQFLRLETRPGMENSCSLYTWVKIINFPLNFSKGKSGFWRVFWIIKVPNDPSVAALQDVVPALPYWALLGSPVQLGLLSVLGGEMLQSPVLGWNEGLFLGTSDTGIFLSEREPGQGSCIQ